MSDYDWKAVSVSLSADNARMCEIILKADALAAALRRFGDRHFAIRKALEDYETARQGQ